MEKIYGGENWYHWWSNSDCSSVKLQGIYIYIFLEESICSGIIFIKEHYRMDFHGNSIKQLFPFTRENSLGPDAHNFSTDNNFSNDKYTNTHTHTMCDISVLNPSFGKWYYILCEQMNDKKGIHINDMNLIMEQFSKKKRKFHSFLLHCFLFSTKGFASTFYTKFFHHFNH